MLKKIIAFSLAEVLLVAGIAAVVGAMTIPNMKKSYEKKARIAKAKTTFATLDGAISQLDYTKILRGNATTENRSLAMLTELKDNVQFRYVCGVQKSPAACFKATTFNDSSKKSDTLNINDAYHTLSAQKRYCSSAIMKSGPEVAICFVNGTPNNDGIYRDFYGFIIVDVDGAVKGSSTRGEDIFVFNIGSSGLSYFPNSMEANLLDN